MARTEAHQRADEKYRSRHVTILLRLDTDNPYDREILEVLEVVRGDLSRGGWMRVFGKPAIAKALGILTPPPATGGRADEFEDG